MASNNPNSSTNEQSQASDEARPDVAAAVDELLNSLSNKFASVSSEIFAKMDEMSRRIDKLEAELVESKAGEGTPSKPQ
uniref:Heat shock factor binding protein 1 n=1 Tax=Bionectria ochroleuca TaxID=29856 RepID=A0A8H7NG43_BIOOC